MVGLFIFTFLTACGGESRTNQIAETLIDGNYRYHYSGSPVRLKEGVLFKQGEIEIQLNSISNDENCVLMEVDAKLGIENVRYTLTDPSTAKIVYTGSEGISMGRSGNAPYNISLTKTIFNEDLYEIGETTIDPKWKDFIIQFYIMDTKGNEFLIPRTEVQKNVNVKN